jgi:hypothetical protein
VVFLMPRTADANSCLTCRRRRIRCDNRLPVCERCEKRDVYCDRSSPLVVKQYTPESGVDLDKTPRELLQEALIAKLFVSARTSAVNAMLSEMASLTILTTACLHQRLSTLVRLV